MPALAILAAIATTAAPPPADACRPAPVIEARSTTPLAPRKLGQLPDGYLMRAVLLKIGPCSVKLVREPAGLSPGVWRYEPDGPAAASPSPARAPTGR